MTTEVETKPAAPADDVPIKEELKEVEKETEKTDQETEKSKKDEVKKKSATLTKPAVNKTDFEKDTVYLYQLFRTPLLPSISPSCLKVETYLRVAGIRYENVDHRLNLLSKKGLLPFVELNGEQICDSAVIINSLSTRYDKDLNSGLTQEQRNLSHALHCMIEGHLYWVFTNWTASDPCRTMRAYHIDLRKVLHSKCPAALLNLGFRMRLRAKCKEVRATGLGRHTNEEIDALGCQDLKVLADQLKDQKFFFGEDPTLLDITVFANIAPLVYQDKEVPCQLRTYLEENHTNLLEHANRIKERYYPDWDEMCSTLELNTHLPKPPPKEPEAPEADQKKSKDGGDADDKKGEEKSSDVKPVDASGDKQTDDEKPTEKAEEEAAETKE